MGTTSQNAANNKLTNAVLSGTTQVAAAAGSGARVVQADASGNLSATAAVSSFLTSTDLANLQAFAAALG